MVNTLVERRLQDFERRCGSVALRLAYHAALPVALNPELLHFLRINFFAEELPYTVEFEFLTSGLCREIGSDLYEIEPEIRNELLLRLAREDNGRKIILDVATLVWQYVEYHAPWTENQELERAQQLTALNFLDPKAAQLWLENAETDKASQGVGGERQWLIAMRQEIKQLPDLSSFDVFLSEKNVDYTTLRDLLAAGEWKEADFETGKVMRQAAGKESEGWFNGEDLDNFPCEDLRTINQLWLHYSDGKFGFSVQKKIYESLGGTKIDNERVWENFCDRIGWRKGGKFLNYSDLTFNLALAPQAHLPMAFDLIFHFDPNLSKVAPQALRRHQEYYITLHLPRKQNKISSLAQRLVTCKI